MNIIGISGLIIVAYFSGACSAWKPLSPEETLFTYTRCMEDIAAGDLELAKKWMIWQVEEDPKTACYVKCVVVGLGLFDNSSKTFKGDHILEQYEKYKQYTSQDEAGVKEFQKAVQDLKIVRSSNCLTLLKRYLPVHAKFTDVEQNVFFGKKEITDKIYSSDDPAEVKRDFHMINVADKDAAVDNALNNCKVKEATKATDYNDCLWKDPNLKDLMMPVFDYREVRSESYLHYILNPEPYDVAKVKEKVKKYDKDAGC
ncbi:long form D7Bclu1 salivary protein [Culex quinquefasciatus]|uniref:Long form D7Bclu1 salivary protein n=1 Tax=Culex quinquefasciatus TaxID=7176 RepID=B0X6Z0_CULQU|nr:long form D7Bclu1 salivary protein [Culex quinquefasciatus]|eukprot:XP_001865412.1 long form D7Bclu1 salivary protein [Culex quinquefasciatus]